MIKNGSTKDNMRLKNSSPIAVDSGNDDENHDDDDEEVVYTAAGGSNGAAAAAAASNQVKIELEPNYINRPRHTFFMASSFDGHNGNGTNKQLRRMHFVKAEESSDETQCMRSYKFFLLNLSFFIYVS